MPDLTNHNISRYHVLERLAKDGGRPSKMAHDTCLDRDAALHVIRVEKSDDPQFPNRSEREVNILVQLVLLIIINNYDYGESTSCPPLSG
jgi:hypothetical protein